MIVQQVSVHQNAYEANFGCRGETCFRKMEGCHAIARLQMIIKLSSESRKSVTALCFHPVSRHKPVQFSVRLIVLKVILH